MEDLLLQEVKPRLESGIAQTVPLVGSDDCEELVQDGLVMAMRILHSAQKAGKTVTAGNVAYYTLKRLRSGRRSTGYSEADSLHAATQLRGRSRVHSLEEPIVGNTGDESIGEPMTIGEALASREDDPATEAARRLDWGQLVQTLDSVSKEILRTLGSGYKLTRLASRLGRSPSTLQYIKRRLEEKRGNARHHAQKIVALSEIYGVEKVQRALEDAWAYQAFSCEYIANILEQRERPVTQPGALHLTRQQDLLDLDLPAPDLTLYKSEEGGVS
jgi:DNA-binding CsgD family transcriptional regulator